VNIPAVVFWGVMPCSRWLPMFQTLKMQAGMNLPDYEMLHTRRPQHGCFHSYGKGHRKISDHQRTRKSVIGELRVQYCSRKRRQWEWGRTGHQMKYFYVCVRETAQPKTVKVSKSKASPVTGREGP
jgi:hypothetical protein